MNESLSRELERELNRLPILEQESWRVPLIVSQLAEFPTEAPKRLPAYSLIGREATRKELHELAGKADALVGHIASLHAPAIGALANRGIMRSAIVASLQSMAENARELARSPLQDVQESRGRGRPTNELARVLAHMLKSHYEVLTGKRATRRTQWSDGKAYGPFLDFMRAVFSLLSVDGSPEALLKGLARSRDENGSK